MRKTPLKKYNSRTREKRKQDRGGLEGFYKKHIQHIKNNSVHCQECGEKLIGDVSEVAHILPKSKFKSISTEDKNVLYLCGWMSNKNCHNKFDSSPNDVFKQMSVFSDVKAIVTELLDITTEKINWKLLDRYE